ncbi:MAG: hypothetical protein JG776_2466 [Caloramator sp.]|uniref:glycosyltransferase n=1 Tax=Caloramator sp. TaxID=1871330 RepID=UPI001D2BD3C3|nr:glycosyltransferase [Caloramator sp.]MBZ4664742.1 hypothetical protein [Caloramator sp.]
MQIRPDAYSVRYGGGDTTQLEKTKEKLTKLGVEVDVSTSFNANLNNYDIVHLFNITRIQETYLHAKRCMQINKPYVLSTIYQSKNNISYYEQNGLYGLPGIISKVFKNENTLQNIKSIAYTLQSKQSIVPFFTQLKYGFVNEQLEVLTNASMLLPNSEMEMKTINKEFNLQLNNYYIVPNGVEVNDEILQVSTDLWNNKRHINNFIICPGRIEPLKNQINVIKALSDTGLDIVFAGGINEKHRKYYNDFISLVNKSPKLHYVGKLSREMLFSAYKNAKVCVLASWFETTGLVGLEAGMMDCNVVITEKGYTKEYYGDYCWYCRPDDLNSIRNSVIQAYNHRKGYFSLKNQIREKYTWEKAAEITLKAYEHVLNSNIG